MESAQHATPVMELSALKLLVRNHRGCLKNLQKAKSREQIQYWSNGCEHWDSEINTLLAKADGIVGKPNPSVVDMINELNKNLESLAKDQPLIAKDLGYRFNAIMDTLILDASQKEIAAKEEKPLMKIVE